MKSLTWEYSSKEVNGHVQRDFNIKIKETVEFVVKRFIPTFVEVVGEFASDQEEMTTSTAQEKLKKIGYYNGEVDGKAGPQTIKALRNFQIDNYLEVTGRLDLRTIKALRNI
jgi:hypothetical protein